jgi:hypothetical protein
MILTTVSSDGIKKKFLAKSAKGAEKQKISRFARNDNTYKSLRPLRALRETKSGIKKKFLAKHATSAKKSFFFINSLRSLRPLREIKTKGGTP